MKLLTHLPNLLVFLCLLLPPQAEAQGGATAAWVDFQCDNGTSIHYLSPDKDMILTKIAITAPDTNVRTLVRLVDGNIVSSVAISHDTLVMWYQMVDTSITNHSFPVLGAQLFPDSIFLKTMPLSPWRNGIDTLHYAVDSIMSTATELVVTIEIPDTYELPYAGGGRGCPEHHEIIALDGIDSNGPIGTQGVDLSSGDPLTASFPHNGNPGGVCVTAKVIQKDLGQWVEDFPVRDIFIPNITGQVCYEYLLSTSVENAFGKPELLAWPNPCTDKLSVSGLERDEGYTIYDAFGKFIASGKAEAETLELNTESWTPGMYTLVPKSSSGVRIVRQ